MWERRGQEQGHAELDSPFFKGKPNFQENTYVNGEGNSLMTLTRFSPFERSGQIDKCFDGNCVPFCRLCGVA